MLATAVAVLFLKAPTPERVSVGFLSSTNDKVNTKLIFKGTNGLPRTITFEAFVNWKIPVKVATTSLPIRPPRIACENVDPGDTFTFSLNLPPKGTDWWVEWCFEESDHFPTRWDKVRAGCSTFVENLGMPKLASFLSASPRRHYIYLTDLKD